MLVEVLLQLLVGIINVELLKPVHLVDRKKAEHTPPHDYTVSVTCFHVSPPAGYSAQADPPHLEVLKTKYVQDSNRLEVVLPFDFLIQPHDDPREALGV